VITLV